MVEQSPTPPAQVARVAGDHVRYLVRFLRTNGGFLALLFFCLLLPMWGFAALVGEVHEKEGFALDAPALKVLHGLASPALDRFFVVMSRLGFTWGVVPVEVLVLLGLAVARRFRSVAFFAVSVVGSALLNLAAKNYFARTRPALWLSIVPETTFSFPSGHAMGSATLGAALILLCWRTRWRWPVAVAMVAFVALVSVSRVYLGVHYPSDILAGWTAATAWVVGSYLLVERRAPPPPATAGKDTVGGAAANA